MSTEIIETTIFRTVEEIETLVRDFKSCVLPRVRWTHQAHLCVALWHVHHYNWETAVRLVRAGIKSYNAHHAVADTPTGGYHETITLFWLRVVRDFHVRTWTPASSLPELAHELFEESHRGLPLEHYSRERLFSTEARGRWVEPDLKPLGGFRNRHARRFVSG